VGKFRGNAQKMIKVPTLRNIVETAPYFHNGMIWSLKDAVKEMSNVQVSYKIDDEDGKSGGFKLDIKPINLTKKDIDSIVTFLGSLTGEKPKIEYPQLPKSRENTPKPNLN
jgi:cytochrome c peroxidase